MKVCKLIHVGSTLEDRYGRTQTHKHDHLNNVGVMCTSDHTWITQTTDILGYWKKEINKTQGNKEPNSLGIITLGLVLD